jgi:hypothetical protein
MVDGCAGDAGGDDLCDVDRGVGDPDGDEVIIFLKWFAFPPHIVKHAVEGLETLAGWIVVALEWLTREFL